MITLYHSPQSRSTSVVSLLRMMGKDTDVRIEIVDILRQGGLGRIDARNPHPEGKVPVLEVDGRLIRERGAIMLWLTDHFDSPLGRKADAPGRGDYLSWLFYYGNVMEPVLHMDFLEMADNPLVKSWVRDSGTMMDTLKRTLSGQDYLVDDAISAADILMVSPFQWFPDLVPATGPVRDWIARCGAAQDIAALDAHEASAMDALGLIQPERQSA